MRWTKGFFYLILMLCLASACGQEAFDIKKATTQFDQIASKLNQPEIKQTEVKSAINALDELKKQAEACVNYNKGQLNDFKAGIKKIQGDVNSDKKLRFVESKKAILQKNLEACQVVLLKTQGALDEFKEKLATLKEQSLLTKEVPVWALGTVDKTEQAKQKTFVDIEQLITLFTPQFASLVLTVIVSLLLVGFFVKRRIKQYISLNHKENSFLAVLHHYILFLFLFGGLAFFCYLYNNKGLYALILLSAHLFIVFFLCLLLSFALPLKKQNPHVFVLSIEKSRAIFFSFIVFASVAILTVWLRPLFIYSDFSYLAVRVFDLVSVTVVAILFMQLGWSVCSLFHKTQALIAIKNTLKFMFFAIALVTIALEWIGFHDIAAFILRGIYRSVVLLILFYVSIYTIKHATKNFLKKHKKISKALSIKPHRIFIELVIIKYVLYVFLLFALVALMVDVWATDPKTVDKVYDAFVLGIVTSKVSLSPLKIIYGFLIFTVLSLAGRLLATHIGKQFLAEGEEEDKQVAISTIFIYVGYSIALLVGLVVIGINFTGLAIIAGALSVGVGLGLQEIVNNFVSGIILLIERPIKAGDRVLVGDVEGFVRKVRVRSTQIETLSHEDVIVPNSELISTRVTNYMFRDPLWRITCKVGVAYGSNVDKVKKILFDVAESHEKVLKAPPHNPRVLFYEFGESSLNFELWCIIQDVNEKHKVVSDLNTLINNRFEQEGIVIAFPQRDIHLKNTEAIPLEKKKNELRE